MFIEQLQRSAREQASATMNRIKAGTPLTASNVAVGDYAMTNSFMYGRQAQDEREYLHYRGWSYASIRPLAVTIAGQPVRVARKTSRRRPSPKRTYKAASLGINRFPHWLKQANPQSLDIYEDHPILDVFDQPNDIMGKWHLIYVTVASLQLTGRQHWWITVDKNEKRPVIWPIPSSWIQPIHTKEREFDHWSLMPGGTGEPVDIPKDEIVYFYYPDPGSPLGVVSPLAACSRMVVADDAIWEAQSRSFRQGIWPGLAVIAGEYVDEEGEDGGRPLLERDQRQQIYNAIRRSWGGVMNMNEPLILDALIKDVKKVTSTPAEMDFMQSSKMTKSAIQQTFGTNPSVNGEIEGLNRATSVAGRYNFADFSVNPLIQMISETLTFSIGVALAQDDEEKVFVWIEPYHPDEQGERRMNYQIASTVGAKLRQNEVRTLLCNLPPLTEEEGGEEFCQAAQKPGGGPPKGAEDAAVAGEPFQPAEQNQDSQVTSDGDAADSASDMSADASDDKRLRITHQKANGKLVPKAPSRIRQNSIERRERRKRRKALYLKAHSRHEGKLVSLLKKFFHEQAVSCMKSLSEIKRPEAMTARHLVDAIYDPVTWTKQLRMIVAPELHKAMLKGGMTEWSSAMTRHHVTAKAADVDDILIDLPPAIKHAVHEALEGLMDADFWDDVSDDTREELIESLAEGIENHESMYELCARIGDDPTSEIGLENPGIFEPGGTFGSNPVLGDGPSTARAKLIARTECLRGDMVVDGARAVAIHKRWYEGPLIEIVTESGAKFAASPNHPMLTARGWIALGELTETDDLIANSGNIEDSRSPGDVNVATPPTKISELWDSLTAVGNVVRRRSTNMDFHGDGMDGYVDIHWPSRLLRIGRFTPVNEFSADSIFAPSDMISRKTFFIAVCRNPFSRNFPVDQSHPLIESSECAARSDYGALNRTPINIVFDAEFLSGDARSILGSNLSFRQVNDEVRTVSTREERAACLFERSSRYSGGGECGANRIFGKTSAFFDFRSTESRVVEVANFGDTIKRDSSLGRLRRPPADTNAPKELKECAGIATEYLRDFCGAHPSCVKRDRLVSLRRIEGWSGHVFNLTTMDGYFSANGLYTGNTTGAMNAGHLAAIDSLIEDGIATGKSWSAIDDEHTREAHAIADDEYGRDNPIPADQAFILHDEKAGDVEAQYPGDIDLPPSQRCQCRCLATAVFSDDAEDTADEGEDGGQEDVGDGTADLDYEEASTTAIAKVVSESVSKAVQAWAMKWDESQHPRAADGKFGSGGGSDGAKPGKLTEAQEERQAAREAVKTLAALHQAGDHANGVISKAVDVTKYSAKAVKAAGKHVHDKIKELVEKHPKTAKLIATAAVIAASEAVVHLLVPEGIGPALHLGIATSAELCAEHIKDFAAHIIGLAAEKSLGESDPTDEDVPAIMRAGKEFWDEVVSSFDPPTDALVKVPAADKP